MILYLFKPFGADNYLCLSKPEEITKFFDNLTPGDEFIFRVLELSDEEYESLENFNGFAGPMGGEGETETEEEPVEEAPPPEEEEMEEEEIPEEEEKV